jgi:hypothetical protein
MMLGDLIVVISNGVKQRSAALKRILTAFETVERLLNHGAVTPSDVSGAIAVTMDHFVQLRNAIVLTDVEYSSTALQHEMNRMHPSRLIMLDTLCDVIRNDPQKKAQAHMSPTKCMSRLRRLEVNTAVVINLGLDLFVRLTTKFLVPIPVMASSALTSFAFPDATCRALARSDSCSRGLESRQAMVSWTRQVLFDEMGKHGRGAFKVNLARLTAVISIWLNLVMTNEPLETWGVLNDRLYEPSEYAQALDDLQYVGCCRCEATATCCVTEATHCVTDVAVAKQRQHATVSPVSQATEASSTVMRACTRVMLSVLLVASQQVPEQTGRVPSVC